MRKALTLLAAITALSGCGEGETTETTEAAPSSSAAPTTTAAQATTEAEDVAGESNCVMAALTYGPIGSGLADDVDLEGVIQYAGDMDLDPATSQPGKDAAVAIAELGFEVALAQAAVLTGTPVDRPALQTAFTAMEEACSLVVS